MKGYRGNPNDGTPMMGKTGTTDSSNQTWLVSSSTAVTTALWFGNVQGNYKISNYPGGINNRHNLSKPINAAANSLYGGAAFDKPADRLLNGAGINAPDLIGNPMATAQSIVTGLKLVFVDGGPVDSDAPAGSVATTTPPAGTVMARGQSIIVYSSNGALTTMPDVVSGSPNVDTAKSTLASAGFTSVEEKCVQLSPNDVANDKRVLSSNPAPGTVARLSDGVTLGVGRISC